MEVSYFEQCFGFSYDSFVFKCSDKKSAANLSNIKALVWRIEEQVDMETLVALVAEVYTLRLENDRLNEQWHGIRN